jgi:hypothetical protein
MPRRFMPLFSCAVVVALAAQGLELFRSNPIDFRLRNSPTSQKYLIETMPGGVALSTTMATACSTFFWSTQASSAIR